LLGSFIFSLTDNRFRSAGTAQIGGNWSMVDHDGTLRTAAHYSSFIYPFSFVLV
jgi:hypothetical protein